MRNTLIIVISILFLASCKHQEPNSHYVDGVSNPEINLNGIWKINTNPPEEFWTLNTLNEEWKEVQVPGECAMQGVSVKHDIPFAYKKNIYIPEDYYGKRIEIQFDGVYSYARVWVNGKYIRDHSGGFTEWVCDITPFVEPGETAMLTLEVTDKADDISYASGYAKHQIGGILGDVNLVALPNNYPDDITIITDFDENFEHASFVVSGQTKKMNQNAELSIELFDSSNTKIHLDNNSVSFNNDSVFQISNLIEHPLKWDAEHPNLYSLEVSFSENGQLKWRNTYKVGFREITIDGNKLRVNGKKIKLRGACRHNIHPLLGRVSTPEYELQDVLLAKEANMNFIRTSHYPPTENFLRLCDEYGIYVEDETAVCFVGSHRTEEYYPGASESNPDFTSRYMTQLEEMVTNHKNHPSVILWSIGNENSFGTNFKKSYDWVKKHDNTRPVIFSYPGKVPDSIEAYDILSMHYPGINGNMNQYGKVTNDFGYSDMPVIFDEWAHVACYNNFTVMEDPNIRSFWGQSLDSMWHKTFDSDGGLGGAIWGMIDETFMLPDSLPGFNDWWGKIDKNVIPAAYSGNTVGYGEWGIIDTWRRKKPEFWNTKKAYSPVKLLKTEIEYPVEGEVTKLPLYNRFDHTNINELTIHLIDSGRVEKLIAPDIDPHTKGLLHIPAREWKHDKHVFIEFIDTKNKLIDKYKLKFKATEDIKYYSDAIENILIEENENLLVLICENQTRISFDKNTGWISNIQQESKDYAISGPHLNLRTKGNSIIYSYHKINDYGKNWKLNKFDYKNDGKSVSLVIAGEYDNAIPVEYKLIVSSNGEILIQYQVENIPQEIIREVGIKFELEDAYDALSWERDSYWSYYPDDHLSSTMGAELLYSNIQKQYRTDPQKDWNQDTKSFYYSGTKDEVINQLTNIAKSTKENIRKYSLLRNEQEMISIYGSGDLSGRLNKVEEKLHLYVNNQIDYIDLSWGNYQRNIVLNKTYSNKVIIKINTHSNILYK
ncbi:MAG: glycoside hydrolase family 2 TIM barrel-domain containing protein [Bacteroidota bacterium]